MNFIAQKLKSTFFQETQNAKFNLLINANIQNALTVNQKQKPNLQSNNKKASQNNSLIPLSRFGNIKQQTEMNIESKLNQLKKRSYSQKKLMTQTNLQIPINSEINNKKRQMLVSASSSKIQNVNLALDIHVEKQKILNKKLLLSKSQTKKNQPSQNKKLQVSNVVFPQTISSNADSHSSKLKLKYMTPLKSQRALCFSIDPLSNKIALQSKVVHMIGKSSEIQLGLISQQKKLSQAQTITRQELVNNLNSTMALLATNGRIIQEGSDYHQLQRMIRQKRRQNTLFGQNLGNHLMKIKKLIEKQKVSCQVDVWKIMGLQNRKVISNWEILNLFSNFNEVIKNIKKDKRKIVGLSFYYPDLAKGSNLAAIKITNFLRQIGFKNKSFGKAVLVGKVRIIQKYWKDALKLKMHRRLLIENAQKKIQECRRMQQKFTANYQLIKTSRKVEVHIGSLSFEQFKRITIEKKEHFQNTHLARIFKSLQSPDSFIVYVTPFQLSQSLLKYYQRLFKISSGSDTALREKVYFVYPENAERLSKLCELSTLNYLLCSPRALKRIKFLIKTISSPQNAYVIPSYPSVEYINLSYELGIPLFSASMAYCKLYSTKIGYRQIVQPIIQREKLNSPFRLLKCVSSIFSQKELVNTLALLIYKNQSTKRWYLKVDDQFSSRGLAYFNVNSINLLKKLNNPNNEDALAQFQGNQKDIVKLIADQLGDKLQKRLKILHKQIYPTYQQFITHFLTRGGVIQAAPKVSQSDMKQVSISFVIQPNGDFEILGSFNKLELGSKSVCNAVRYPAKDCSNLDPEKIVRHLYRRIYLKLKFYGFFTVDLLVETKQYKMNPYVIGLSCFLTIETGGLFLVKQLTKVRYDKDTNQFLKLQSLGNHYDASSLENSKISKLEFEQSQKSEPIQSSPSELAYCQKQSPQNNKIQFIYCPKIALPGLESMSEFFRKCKFQNISFDLKLLTGSLFIPIDDLQCENIGFFICDKKLQSLNIEIMKVIDFLSKNYRTSIQGKMKHNKRSSKREIDEVGMLRSVLIGEINRQEWQMKTKREALGKGKIQKGSSNLDFF